MGGRPHDREPSDAIIPIFMKNIYPIELSVTYHVPLVGSEQLLVITGRILSFDGTIATAPPVAAVFRNAHRMGIDEFLTLKCRGL